MSARNFDLSTNTRLVGPTIQKHEGFIVSWGRDDGDLLTASKTWCKPG
jgi:hypothetical protein